MPSRSDQPPPTPVESPAQLLRAGSDRWELWQLGSAQPRPLPLPEPTTDPDSDPGATPPALAAATALAIPLRQCFCLRLELPAPEGIDPLEALPLELEAQGLVSAGSPHSWTAQPLGGPHPADGGEEGERLQRVQVLLPTGEALELARELDAPQALCSALTLPLPTDGLCLWHELDRPVCALTRAGSLIHAQALGSPAFDSAAAREILAIRRALQAEGVLAGDFTAVHLFAAVDPPATFAETLGQAPQRIGPLPPPRWPDAKVPRPPLPHLNEAADAKRRRRRRMLIGLALAAVVFIWLGLGTFNWIYLSVVKNRLEQALAELRPRSADLVETNESYLQAVAPLLLDDQPLELYLAIHRLRPSGVRLESLSIDAASGSLELNGIAGSTADALEFQGNLEAAPDLAGWTWESRSPSLDAGGSADFRFNATR